jgi:hypothetical protein
LSGLESMPSRSRGALPASGPLPQDIRANDSKPMLCQPLTASSPARPFRFDRTPPVPPELNRLTPDRLKLQRHKHPLPFQMIPARAGRLRLAPTPRFPPFVAPGSWPAPSLCRGDCKVRTGCASFAVVRTATVSERWRRHKSDYQLGLRQKEPPAKRVPPFLIIPTGLMCLDKLWATIGRGIRRGKNQKPDALD